MDSERDGWTVNHFSQANPKGKGQDDVAVLLEGVADSIRSLGAIRVQDITFHDEIDQDGQHAPTMTVYYDKP
jgi:hypothetical protein